MASRAAILAAFTVLTSTLGPARHHVDEASTRAAMDSWEAILGELADLALMAGVVAYLRTPNCKFWPSPGEVLAAIPGRQAIDDADSAWGDLLAHVRRHGWPDPPGQGWDLDPDPARREAMARGLSALGGWRAVCALEHDDIAAARASFRSAYRTVRQREAAAIEARAVRELMAARGIDIRQIGVDPLADKPPVPIPQPVSARRDDDDEEDE